MKIIKPPKKIETVPKSIFLAGSIEMGEAENWQSKVERLLADTDWVILNPRRDDWDSSWEQKIENKQFRKQVEWELEGSENATIIFLYFAPDTKSPISLLELGLFAHSKRMIVICPEGFWRKGNVDIVCKKYGIKTANSIEKAIKIISKLCQKEFLKVELRDRKGCGISSGFLKKSPLTKEK